MIGRIEGMLLLRNHNFILSLVSAFSNLSDGFQINNRFLVIGEGFTSIDKRSIF